MQEDCLTDALSDPTTEGVWAGLTKQERQPLLPERGTEPPEAGPPLHPLDEDTHNLDEPEEAGLETLNPTDQDILAAAEPGEEDLTGAEEPPPYPITLHRGRTTGSKVA